MTRCLLSFLFAGLVLLIPSRAIADSETETPLEFDPYRVRLVFVFDGSAVFDAEARERIVTATTRSLDRGFGDLWQTAARTEQEWAWVGRAGLESLTEKHALTLSGGQPIVAEPVSKGSKKSQDNESEEEPPAEPVFDRVAVVTVSGRGGQFRIGVRMWNEDRRMWTPPVFDLGQDLRSVPVMVVDRLVETFEPTVRLESSDGQNFVARVRGGRLPVGDPELAPILPGDVCTPYLKYYDREENLLRVQTIPLTFLHVRGFGSIPEGSSETATSPLDTRIFVNGLQISALRVSLTGNRRRVVSEATRRRRVTDRTRFTFVSQINTEQPIIGYRVAVHPKYTTREELEAEPPEYITDRTGSISVPVLPEQPIVWLYVHSASALVARVPYVPGLEAEKTIEIPDDASRLAIEGRLKIIETELIDTVARRTVLMLKAKKAADKEDWKDTDRYLAELDELVEDRGIRYYERRIRELRAIALQGSGNNRTVERRIRELVDKTEAVIKKHLDETAIKKLKEDIAAVR